MKEEALKLADLMIDVTDCETSEFYRAGQMIRRLVEELDRLDYDLKSLAKRYKALDKTKPLSDEEIRQLYIEMMEAKSPHSQSFFGFARAIEERHGIK